MASRRHAGERCLVVEPSGKLQEMGVVHGPMKGCGEVNNKIRESRTWMEHGAVVCAFVYKKEGPRHQSHSFSCLPSLSNLPAALSRSSQRPNTPRVLTTPLSMGATCGPVKWAPSVVLSHGRRIRPIATGERHEMCTPALRLAQDQVPVKQAQRGQTRARWGLRAEMLLRGPQMLAVDGSGIQVAKTGCRGLAGRVGSVKAARHPSTATCELLHVPQCGFNAQRIHRTLFECSTGHWGIAVLDTCRGPCMWTGRVYEKVWAVWGPVEPRGSPCGRWQAVGTLESDAWLSSPRASCKRWEWCMGR
ncbi:hypothetical protein DAPPUDRAFT_123376 [Daphnia pulex]|uniref:Uncharacterized protein n=1 Tax=Daphnia pulex TaxID=6669 RepID=E9I5R1_DAPPU|nr:hypothetical protein DAPPUDRAFT_123376 [Daphnia pulex]|eukprot:EFX60669.1 hypothetical protein DAPPUDRAFT_123376 [Daphnia pulex]